MANLTPFEIRLELLKMAQTMLEQDYYAKREVIANQFATDCDSAKLQGRDAPQHPGFPPYPSEQEVIAKAQTLNTFVSNIPVETKSKKS
jgi:hypothetical protein